MRIIIRGRRLVPVVACCVVVASIALVPSATAGQGSSTSIEGSAPYPSDLLPRSMHGAAAIEALGGTLDEAAARNGTTSRDLAVQLREDPTFWVDESGLLYVKETTLPPPAPSGTREAAPFPNDQTFKLHSKPGSQRTIYLDFDGQTVSGTAWGTFSGPMPPFDLDSNPQNWSQNEIDVVQSVFSRVAEDYAPFDVDVTTQDPGDDALYRTSSGDAQYGTRVLITPSAEALANNCGSCGGVAYVGTFDLVGNSYYQPAWVFPQQLSNNAKYIAEAASHESGHNLGLSHDGTSTVGYYRGHRDWAPIMGVGYYQPISQWSKGEYTDANNTEDDFAVIQANGLSLRPDDHGSSIGSADPLGTGTSATGLIESRTDRDVFSIRRQCSEDTTITVTPAAVSPNLDISLRLLTPDGTVVATNDPASAFRTVDSATGLDAALNLNLETGNYVVEIDGVGVLDPTTGYSDYGSVGAYSLNVSACSGTTAPGIPLNVTVTKDDAARSATISWEPPASDGGSGITGYRVARDRGTPAGKKNPWTKVVGPDARSQTFAKLKSGSTFALTVEAINAIGTGPAATENVTIGGAANLLKNPGFERDSNGDGRPNSWASSARFTRSAAVVHSGRHSGRHRATKNSDYIVTQVAKSLSPQTSYGFSGWVNIPATADSFTFTIRVRWRNHNNKLLRTDVVSTDSVATAGWNQVLRTMTSPAKTKNAQVQMVATDLKATVYVDDFELSRVTQ